MDRLQLSPADDGSSMISPSSLECSRNESTPMNVLPLELFRHIFLLLLREKNSRMTLCSVCHRWRDIVEATPEFWTNIDILDFGFDINVTDACQWARRAVRAGLIPVNVNWQIHSTAFSAEYGIDLEKDVLKVIPFSQWKSLRICAMSGFPFLDQPAVKLEGSFDVLEELTIVYVNGNWKPIYDLIGQTASQLHTLKVQGTWDSIPTQFTNEVLFRVSTLFCPFLPRSPIRDQNGITSMSIFRQLKILEVEIFYLRDTQPFHFPKLEKLVIHQVDTHDPFALYSNCPPIVFPNLREWTCGAKSIDILTLFAVPKLETITFTDSSICRWQLDGLRSQLSITKVILPKRLVFNTSILLEDLLDFLLCFPDIERLEASLRLPYPSRFSFNDDDEQNNVWSYCRPLLEQILTEAGIQTPSNSECISEDTGNTGRPRDMGPFSRHAWVPNLVSLKLKLPFSLGNYYQAWQDFIYQVFTARRYSNLESIECTWEDGGKLRVHKDFV